MTLCGVPPPDSLHIAPLLARLLPLRLFPKLFPLRFTSSLSSHAQPPHAPPNTPLKKHSRGWRSTLLHPQHRRPEPPGGSAPTITDSEAESNLPRRWEFKILDFKFEIIDVSRAPSSPPGRILPPHMRHWMPKLSSHCQALEALQESPSCCAKVGLQVVVCWSCRQRSGGRQSEGQEPRWSCVLITEAPVWTWNPLQPRGSDKPQSTLSREGANDDFCATISHLPRLAIGAKCWKNWSKAGCVRRARSTSLAVGSRSEFRHSSTNDLDFGVGMKGRRRLRRNWILVGNRVPHLGWDHGDGFAKVRLIADQRRGLMCMDFCEFHPLFLHAFGMHLGSLVYRGWDWQRFLKRSGVQGWVCWRSDNGLTDEAAAKCDWDLG